MKRAKDVDEYIGAAPPKQQPRLKALRKLIRSIAPQALERISYGMPFYDYNGRLVYFAAANNYIGLYIPLPIIDDHKKDLTGYTTTKSAIHLPMDEPLPVSLIKKLVMARMKYNEQNKKLN